MTLLICDVCPRSCKLEEGQTGFCQVRKNEDGRNVDLYAGRIWPTVLPAPSGPTYVVSLFGCNLRCPFCLWRSRWREEPPARMLSEAELTDLAEDMVVFSGGEPLVHHEYVTKTHDLCKAHGKAVGVLTSGYVSPWLADSVGKWIDAITVGVKGSLSRETYALMGADPNDVLEATRILHRNHPSLWITDLVGPGPPAGPEDHRRFAAWIRRELNPAVRVVVEPLHEACSGPSLERCRACPCEYVGGTPRAWEYVYEVGCLLAGEGLKDVWIRDPVAIDAHPGCVCEVKIDMNGRLGERWIGRLDGVS